MTQSIAIETSIVALALRPEHGALVEAARGLAEAVDADPANASLWREYRQAIAALLEAVPEENTDDGAATLLKLVHPKVGNAKNPKPKDPRPRRRNAREGAGDTTDAVAAPSRGRRPRTAS